MAYRKIDVDGSTYEYSIGRTHVKIRGFNAVLKEKIGEPVDEDTYAVRPGHIAKYIRKVNKEPTKFAS